MSKPMRINTEYTGYYDTNMMAFTNRWAALAIDIVIAFTIFFVIKATTGGDYGWPLYILIYTTCHTLLPLFQENPRSLGKIIMRIDLIYPEGHSPIKRKVFYILRESIKGISILGTAGIILLVTPMIISEKNKPALHELFTNVVARRRLGKNDRITDDGFDGKLKL